jgi:hypothetical protein
MGGEGRRPNSSFTYSLCTFSCLVRPEAEGRLAERIFRSIGFSLELE